ncbi:MAG: small guanosine triphosphatase family Ras-related in brain (Rab) family protein [Gammaproteobacteria bacterium]|jgi:Ras-related protein Rab-8A|nr:small guanosine triphosphatase family Ras-related in brain (Rab) family protein [Gammaproteobacteria bacterium]
MARSRQDERPIDVLIVGDKSVGKNSLILQEVSKSSTDSHLYKVLDAGPKSKRYDGLGVPGTSHEDVSISANLWNSSSRTAPVTWSNCPLFYVVYDMTDEKSFQNVNDWLSKIKEYGPKDAKIVLIGNKVDKKSDKKVSTQEGEELAAQYGMPFFEVSAKNGDGVNEAFKRGVNDVVLQRIQESAKLPSPVVPKPSPVAPQPSLVGQIVGAIPAVISWPFRMLWLGITGLYNKISSGLASSDDAARAAQVRSAPQEAERYKVAAEKIRRELVITKNTLQQREGEIEKLKQQVQQQSSQAVSHNHLDGNNLPLSSGRRPRGQSS